ncbi:hypothetical protein [Virgibacillus oceani]|uniref:Uncharacterized protein n=1 Tax=Virgibacillus oceani TaxID=1479511 RepID=A0A917M0Z3_9BACI|nr:hypothetical protein [Virgibacillus oceani]GGG70352.1 hypothetical protein GCM10011398_13040 [Virgibacillus oceani]
MYFDKRQYDGNSFPDQDERVFPVVPFLTGLAVAPFLYGAFYPGFGGYYPYPPRPPYYPYGYGYGPGYGYDPNFNKGYY